MNSRNPDITDPCATSRKAQDTLITRTYQERPNSPCLNRIGRFIKDAKSVVWSTTTFDKDQDPLDLLNSIIYKVHGFLNTIWLFLDNSIDTEMGFLLYENDGMPTASSSYINFAPYAADGKSRITSINREQLREIRKFHREHVIPETFGMYPVTKVVKDETRITRALYFVLAARGSTDLGIKIMHYCTALETLFSTSQAELAHQLSERIAHFSESKPDKRIETYRMMKKAYTLRSKITHGSAFPAKDFDDLLNLSVACDDLLRRSFKRMSSDHDMAKMFGIEARLDDYFIELIFGLQNT